MTLDSGLDKSFWNFAVEFCSYTRNRVPCKPHQHTPYEEVFGVKPDVSCLHIFGETCYVLKTPSEASGKLDAKSKRGLFLGYEPSTKDTYNIWCDGKLVLSRNVTFLGLTENQSSTPKSSEANLSHLPSFAEHLAVTPLDDDLTDLEECAEVITEESAEGASDLGETRNEV